MDIEGVPDGNMDGDADGDGDTVDEAMTEADSVGEADTLAELLKLGVELGLTGEGETVALRELDGDCEEEVEGEGQLINSSAELRL